MTDEIRPALTPEEWERGVARIDSETFAALRDRHLYFAALGMTKGTVTADWIIRDSTATCEEPFTLMALANAALGDDDPRKITREKVDAMQEAADESGFVRHYDALVDSLIETLRALLPPLP